MTSPVDLALGLNILNGWPLFFCNNRKRPTCPNGFHDAAGTPGGISALWREHPGPLVALATGAMSGISVLDIDAKHPEALAWLEQHRPVLPPTLCVTTRSGGQHWFYRHVDGLKCRVAVNKVPGVDIRADGGYVILWALHGCQTILSVQSATWPVDVLPPPPPRPARPERPAKLPDDANLGALIKFVHNSAEGQRNNRLYWAGRRLRELVDAGSVTKSSAIALLARAGQDAGLPKIEAERTAKSAVEGSTN